MAESDVTDSYVRWLNDPLVNRHLESRFQVHSLASVKQYVASLENTDKHLYGIFCVETRQHIGNIKLEINREHLVGDIGLMIGEKCFWGKGVATKSIRLIERIAKQHKLKKLRAGSYVGNVGSIKAFEKAGFVREGLCKLHVINSDGEREDLVLLGKVL